MDKMFWLDEETTGTDHTKHAIIQIGGIIEIDGKDEDEFEILMAPYEGAEISQEALDKNGRTREEIMAFPDMGKGISKLKRILGKYVGKYDRNDKFIVGGYNVGFDTDFLRRAFALAGDPYYGSWFFSCNLDVMTEVAKQVRGGRRYGDHKLETVCPAHDIGFGEKGAHDALADIRATRELYRKLTADSDSFIIRGSSGGYFIRVIESGNVEWSSDRDDATVMSADVAISMMTRLYELGFQSDLAFA